MSRQDGLSSLPHDLGFSLMNTDMDSDLKSSTSGDTGSYTAESDCLENEEDEFQSILDEIKKCLQEADIPSCPLEETLQILMQQKEIEKIHSHCEKILTECQSLPPHQSLPSMNWVASLLCAAMQQHHPEVSCIHLLGFICFIRNHLKASLKILEIGEALDPHHEPTQTLLQEVSRLLLHIEEGDSKKALLAEDGELSAPLKAALAHIFKNFDLDQDGLLSLKEFQSLCKKTSGQPVPIDTLASFLENFDTQDGKLTLTGLFEFYHQQTLAYPEETISDMEAHGFSEFSIPHSGLQS